MLKNVLSFVSSCGHSAHRHRCGFAFAQPFARSLSTNSAINKGLRKSRHGRSRLDPPARLGRFARKVDQGRNIDGFGHGKSNFEPQSRLSIDEQMPTTTRKGSLTLRQRRILQLKDRALAESRHESPNDDSSRNQRANSRSSTTLRLQNQSRRIGGTATKLNRAERRAAAFGHKMNPPEGYKALPITVEKQPSRPSKGSNDDHTTARRRLSSSWRTEHNDKFAAKDWDGNVEESSDERPRRRSTAPLAIPYTTPASEFLYGHSVVTTALKYSRRSFYKLYLYSGDTRGQDRQVRKMALAANVEVTRVGSDWLKLMDKMSGGRPHNVSSETLIP